MKKPGHLADLILEKLGKSKAEPKTKSEAKKGKAEKAGFLKNEFSKMG